MSSGLLVTITLHLYASYDNDNLRSHQLTHANGEEGVTTNDHGYTPINTQVPRQVEDLF